MGLEAGTINYEGVKCYGRVGNDISGENVAYDLYKRTNSDLYLTLPEVWWLRSHKLVEKGLQWVSWCPIDFECPFPRFFLERLSKALAVIPTYRWAEEMLRKHLDNVLNHVYFCGVDTELYAPLAESKEKVYAEFPLTRRSIGNDADFIISVVAMNSRRKNWESLLRAIKLFQDDNVDMRISAYLHTLPTVIEEHDLRLLAEEVGLRNFKFADPLTLLYGYEEQEMTRILNCSDVLLSLSGESGNLPCVEAMSCGTPPVVLDACVNSEIVPFEELKVKVLGHFLSPNPALLKPLPDLDDAVQKLNHVLNSNPATYMKRCREWVLPRFDWKVIANRLVERLETVEDIIEDRCLKVPETSEELKQRMETICE